ncbi:MAG: RNA polymerase sigma factor [Nannocystaceae bacterium]|nr:RNA polymerase sigma factor [Nannocystaceae bacterium]
MPVSEHERLAVLAVDRGDFRATLKALMLAYGPLVYRYCLGQLSDADVAEDVRQTVFVQAYRDLPAYDGRANLRSWLLAIARHRCLDAQRGAQRRNVREPKGPVPVPVMEPDTVVERSQIAELVRRCLAELPSPSREPVVLRFVSELPYPEIASITGIKVSTLQMRVSRAMLVLKTCVERHGGSL